MGGKQIAITVICLIVIAAAAATIFKKQGGSSKPPDEVLQHEIRCVEVGGDQTITMTLAEWQDLSEDAETGYRKKGGTVLALAIDCPHCRKPIPAPRAAEVPGPDGPKPYPCPKCEKNVNEPPMTPPEELPKTALEGSDTK